MYIYNVTINIEESVHDQWLVWMKDKHIPEMLATGKFIKAKMCKVAIEEEMGGITYAMQYTTKDKETLERYYKEDAEKMRRDGAELFGNNFVAFRTELDVISEQIAEVIPATEYLFSYGTLLDETVQTSLFARKLEGTEDQLMEHLVSADKVAGRYPTIAYTGKGEHAVVGKVFSITGKELLKADHYEGEAYYRKKVALASGINAWVYLDNLLNSEELGS